MVYLYGYSHDKIIVEDSIEVKTGPIPTPHLYIKTGYLSIFKLNSEITID